MSIIWHLGLGHGNRFQEPAKHTRARIKQVREEAKGKSVKAEGKLRAQRLLPQINKDILSTQLSKENAFKAGLLLFYAKGPFRPWSKSLPA